MTAVPTIYRVDRRILKNGIIANACVTSHELRCINEPALPANCDGPEWQFVRTYLPLAHGTAQILIFDDGSDKFVALEAIDALAERPPMSTHVVKLLPLRIRMQPMQCAGDNIVFLNPLLMEMSAPLFFFAELRCKDTPNEHLFLFSRESKDR